MHAAQPSQVWLVFSTFEIRDCILVCVVNGYYYYYFFWVCFTLKMLLPCVWSQLTMPTSGVFLLCCGIIVARCIEQIRIYIKWFILCACELFVVVVVLLLNLPRPFGHSAFLIRITHWNAMACLCIIKSCGIANIWHRKNYRAYSWNGIYLLDQCDLNWWQNSHKMFNHRSICWRWFFNFNCVPFVVCGFKSPLICYPNRSRCRAIERQ